MNFPDGAPTWLLVIIVGLWAIREAAARLMGNSESMAGMAMDWAKDMRETVRDHDKKITRLQSRLTEMEQENRALRKWAEDLFQQVKDAGGEPFPFSDYYKHPASE